MRNVWVYALVWHFVVSLSTSRFMGQNYQLFNGIIGVPEFMISAFSSVTLTAQYRSTSFRSSKVLNLFELPDNVGPVWDTVKYQYNFGYRGNGNTYLGGVFIDLKFLICLVIALAIFRATRMAWQHCLATTYHEDEQKNSKWMFLFPTPVSYAAGVMWTLSLCVHWTSDFFCIQDNQEKPHYRHHIQLTESMVIQTWRARNFEAAPYSDGVTEPKLAILNKLCLNVGNVPQSIGMSVNTFRYIQHQMKCLHVRSDVVEANVAFMNVVLMSDPLVFLRMMFKRNPATELAYYQSQLRPRQILLLPVAVVVDHNEYSCGHKLLKRVSAAELTWSELVQCG